MSDKSPKEDSMNRRILELLKGDLREPATRVLADAELHHYQEHANNISIRRLGYNDHGPVHMRKVVLNALTMANLLQEAGVKLSLETEEVGTFSDSLLVLFLSGLMHDIGMSVTREGHEHISAMLAAPLLDRILPMFYGDDIRSTTVARATITECIIGHMALTRIHSLEAGLILIADGCDMEKGRARIPMMLSTGARVGDIHKYSSAAVEKIQIERGKELPIRITVEMNSSVGFFQVEEVLYPKLSCSPAKPFVELYAGIIGDSLKRYL